MVERTEDSKEAQMAVRTGHLWAGPRAEQKANYSVQLWAVWTAGRLVSRSEQQTGHHWAGLWAKKTVVTKACQWAEQKAAH